MTMSDTVEQQRIKCTRCKMNMTIDKFKKKRDDTYQKRCNECNEKVKKWSYCEHNKRRSECKECGGSSICEHNRERSTCKECGGSSICEHNRVRSTCKECGGGSICEHNKRRSTCKECGGGSICEHNRVRSSCKECGGGSICEHNRERNTCKECGGGSICEHNKRRRTCKECNFGGYLKSLVSARIKNALKHKKELHSNEYLGCDIDTLIEHIESQFKEGMTWDNHGEWHIDHITPIAYNKPTLEEQIERLHYSNLQPLWATENIAKGNRFIG